MTNGKQELKILLIAGEASGDKHGAALARALRRLYPETSFEMFGSGGDEMRSAGVETLVDAKDVAIIGIPEIARALGRLYAAYRKLITTARDRKPDVVVLIDWPDFNMRVARALGRDGFKIVYYISPQVWAWRKYRVRALRRDVDRMLVILPFEEEFYKDSGIDVEYVGHPLAESVAVTATRREFAAKHGLDAARPIIALLPGSRKKEIHYHTPALLDAAARLDRKKTDLFPLALQFVVPLASTIDRREIETHIAEAEARNRAKVDVRIVERDLYNAVGHSEVAVVASGTATVEAALVGTPMVIVYRGSQLNWRLIRPLIHLDTFGMVNLIAGRRVAPELMQDDVTGERIAREVETLLSDAERLARARKELATVAEKLRSGGAATNERAA
ncbi:MAG TPA: lipid-A-disaccharide synthase, partial [Blastocatellia bacterium]|nr:lipid-A-disaccharide synthase [Blastocatellia bacterium]